MPSGSILHPTRLWESQLPTSLLTSGGIISLVPGTHATIRTVEGTVDQPAFNLYHLPVEDSLSQVTHGSAMTMGGGELCIFYYEFVFLFLYWVLGHDSFLQLATLLISTYS